MNRILWPKSRPGTEQFILQTVARYDNISETNLRRYCHANGYDMMKVVRFIDWLVREKKLFRYNIRANDHRDYPGCLLSCMDPLHHSALFISDVVEVCESISEPQLLKMCMEIGYSIDVYYSAKDILLKERKVFGRSVTHPTTKASTWVFCHRPA